MAPGRGQRQALLCAAIGVIGKPIPTIGPSQCVSAAGAGPIRMSVMPVVSAYLATGPAMAAC